MAGVHLRRLERLFAQYRSKVEGSLELLFFRSSQRVAGEIFRKGLTKSRRLSGAVLFRVIATGRWRDLSKRIDQKPKTVWSCTFSGHRSGSLERLFAKYRPKAGSCLELYFFGLSQRATWGASRSVWKGSRRLSGRNVFSGYISKGWSGFSQRISPKLEAAWPERLFRAQFRRLVGLFAGYRPKAESCLAGIFFRVITTGRWRDFSKRIDQKPKAVWSCTFSGYRSGSLGDPRGRWEKAAGGCLAETSFRGKSPKAGEVFCSV